MNKIRQDKRGVILVFTLIIMAVLLSTALSFSYFIIADINKARAIDNSVVAYYAADAGIEESLYLLKKQEVVSTLAELKQLKTGGVNMAVSGGAWDISNSTDYEKGFLRQRLSNGQTAKFFILGRGVNDDDNKTKSVMVEWLKGGETSPNLQVSLVQLDPQEKNGSLIYYTDTSVVEVADAISGIGRTCYNLKDIKIDGGSLIGPTDYLVEFKVLGSDNDYVDRLVVKAYNEPCIDITEDVKPNETGITNLTLKSTGKYGKSEQSIIAHILPKDPVSGLLGFVLFSEQDIAKE